MSGNEISICNGFQFGSYKPLNPSDLMDGDDGRITSQQMGELLSNLSEDYKKYICYVDGEISGKSYLIDPQKTGEIKKSVRLSVFKVMDIHFGFLPNEVEGELQYPLPTLSIEESDKYEAIVSGHPDISRIIAQLKIYARKKGLSENDLQKLFRRGELSPGQYYVLKDVDLIKAYCENPLIEVRNNLNKDSSAAETYLTRVVDGFRRIRMELENIERGDPWEAGIAFAVAGFGVSAVAMVVAHLIKKTKGPPPPSSPSGGAGHSGGTSKIQDSILANMMLSSLLLRSNPVASFLGVLLRISPAVASEGTQEQRWRMYEDTWKCKNGRCCQKGLNCDPSE